MPRPPSNTNRSWMTTREVADAFEVTTETVRDWIDKGLLKSTVVRGYNRVERVEAQRYAKVRFGLDDTEPPPV